MIFMHIYIYIHRLLLIIIIDNCSFIFDNYFILIDDYWLLLIMMIDFYL